MYHAGAHIPNFMVVPQAEHTISGRRHVADRATLVLAARGDKAWEEHVIWAQGLKVAPMHLTLKVEC